MHFGGALRDFCMKTFDVTQNGYVVEHLAIARLPKCCSVVPDFLNGRFETRPVHGDRCSWGYLMTIMWVLGVGLTWGEWRWRSGALLHLF